MPWLCIWIDDAQIVANELGNIAKKTHFSEQNIENFGEEHKFNEEINEKK